MSDFDEVLYKRFLGNIVLYFGGSNPVEKFPHPWGEGGWGRGRGGHFKSSGF